MSQEGDHGFDGVDGEQLFQATNHSQIGQVDNDRGLPDKVARQGRRDPPPVTGEDRIQAVQGLGARRTWTRSTWPRG